jgi:hypothetical protein
MNEQQLLQQLQEFRDVITAQQGEIENLRLSVTTAHANPANVSQSREPKVAAPAFFHGNRKDSRNFLLQLKNVFLVQPARFTSEVNKVAYAISYLRDVAFDWVSPFLESNSDILKSFADFEKAFLLAFGDIDRKRRAEKELLTLRQKSRPVSTIVAEFQRLAFETHMNEDALFPLFYNTLNDDVKDEICKVARPLTISEYYNLAIGIDNRLFERKRERKFGPRFIPRVPNQAPARDPHAMIIDNVQNAAIIDNVQKRGPLSESEKQRRRSNNLCLYCGAPDHKLAECPLRPSKSGKGKAQA